MPTIEQLIEEFFRPRDYIDYSNTVKTDNTVFTALFPEVRKQTKKIDIFKADRTNGIAVSAHFHGQDALPEQASFRGAKSHDVNLLPIKREFTLDILDDFALSYNLQGEELKQALRDELYGHIKTDLIDSAEVRAERLRADALQFGKTSIDENGYKDTIDWQAPKKNFYNIDWKTSVETADPLSDLIAIQGEMSTREHVQVVNILTSPEVVAALCRIENVKKRLLGSDSDMLLTAPLFISKMAENGIHISVDGRTYFDEVNGKLLEKRYLDPKKVIFMPNHTLGNTIWGQNDIEVKHRKDGINIMQTGKIGIGEICDQYRDKTFIRGTGTCMVAYPFANEVAVLDVQVPDAPTFSA